jgi:hypothetical protein
MLNADDNSLSLAEFRTQRQLFVMRLIKLVPLFLLWVNLRTKDCCTHSLVPLAVHLVFMVNIVVMEA